MQLQKLLFHSICFFLFYVWINIFSIKEPERDGKHKSSDTESKLELPSNLKDWALKTSKSDKSVIRSRSRSRGDRDRRDRKMMSPVRKQRRSRSRDKRVRSRSRDLPRDRRKRSRSSGRDNKRSHVSPVKKRKNQRLGADRSFNSDSD